MSGGLFVRRTHRAVPGARAQFTQAVHRSNLAVGDRPASAVHVYGVDFPVVVGFDPTADVPLVQNLAEAGRIFAWRCLFGCDAEPRAARTAKMNMIMHGDDRGGIHHHDGLVDINSIFPERFDAVVTNLPV